MLVMWINTSRIIVFVSGAPATVIYEIGSGAATQRLGARSTKRGLVLDNDGGKGRNTRCWCRNVENIFMLRQIEDQVDGQLGVSKKKNHQNDFLLEDEVF